MNTFQYKPLLPSKTIYPIPDQNGQIHYLFSDKNGPKTLSFGGAKKIMGFFWGLPPPPPPPGGMVIYDSPHGRESNAVLHSGFLAVDSKFKVLDSSLCQQILDSGFKFLFRFGIPWAVREWSKSMGGGAERGWVMRFWALCRRWVLQFSATLRGWVILFYYIDGH